MAGQYNFLLKHEYGEVFAAMSDADAGKLIKGIFAYETTGAVPHFSSGEIKMAFLFIKGPLDSNRKKYEERCARNRENGSKGGRPPKEP